MRANGKASGLFRGNPYLSTLEFPDVGWSRAGPEIYCTPISSLMYSNWDTENSLVHPRIHPRIPGTNDNDKYLVAGFSQFWNGVVVLDHLRRTFWENMVNLPLAFGH